MRQFFIHRCEEDGKQRARAEDLWSRVFRWDVQLAGSAARRAKVDLLTRYCEGCDEVAAVGTGGYEEKSKASNVRICIAVRRVPERQRDGAVVFIWQPSSATLAGDELERKARGNCVEQSVVPAAEPREHRVSQSVHRKVERERCRDSGDNDGCSEAQDGADTRLYSEGCRECIGCRVNVGQQELQESEQRREATEGHLPSLRVARGPESGAPRVE